MKVFEIQWTNQQEKEWVAADSIIHAIKTYLSVTSMDITDFEDNDEIIEIPKEKWGEYFVTDEGGLPAKSFEQWMKEHTEPDLIAGTMYN